jgi:hypothetical protein
VRKPNIPKKLRDTLEECGTETIRTVLLHGWANPADLPEVLRGMSSSERKDALAWLQWKDAKQAFRDNVIFGTTVLAAIAAVLALMNPLIFKRT